MKKIMMIMMIAIGVSSVAFGQKTMSNDKNKSVETQITANEQAIWKSLTAGKYDVLANFLAEDYQGVYADGVIDKTNEVAGVKKMQFKKADFSGAKVKMPDADNAIIVYEIHSETVAADGKNSEGNYREMSVWVKRGGKWLVTQHTDFKLEK